MLGAAKWKAIFVKHWRRFSAWKKFQKFSRQIFKSKLSIYANLAKHIQILIKKIAGEFLWLFPNFSSKWGTRPSVLPVKTHAYLIIKSIIILIDFARTSWPMKKKSPSKPEKLRATRNIRKISGWQNFDNLCRIPLRCHK